MAKTIRLFFLLFISLPLCGQNPAYQTFARQADSLFRQGEFADAANAFSQAFETLGWRGYSQDRFTAARAWARAGVSDSAFFQLKRLLEKTDFLDANDEWMLEPDFESLQNDLAWKRLAVQWQLKQARAEQIKNNPLTLELEKIYASDQYYRVKRDSVASLHGEQSPEMSDWAHRWVEQDSLNLLRVSAILDEHGWLGPDVVSDKASRALFLVVQHAPLAAQEKYLPMMQQAVKDGKANIGSLAYLEDRVLMRQGKPQRYGSQVVRDPKSGAWVIHPVEAPANLDARRKSVGLGPIQEYLDAMGAKWKQ